MVRLITARELRNDKELAPKCDNTTIGESFQIDDPEWHTAERVNTYLIDSIKHYEMCGRIDEELWETYQEDFEGWIKELFALAHKDICSTLRDLLRDHSINVGGVKYVSQELYNVLLEDSYKEWPMEEIAKQLRTGRSFDSYQNPFFRAEMEANRAIKHQMQSAQTSHQQRLTAPTNATASETIPLDLALNGQPGATGPALPYQVATSTQSLITKDLTDLNAKSKISRDLGRKAELQVYQPIAIPSPVTVTLSPHTLTPGHTATRTETGQAYQPTVALSSAMATPNSAIGTSSSTTTTLSSPTMTSNLATATPSFPKVTPNPVVTRTEIRPTPQQYLTGSNNDRSNRFGNNRDANVQFWVDRKYEIRDIHRGQRLHGRKRGWGGYGGGNGQNKKCSVYGKWRWYAQERGQGTSAPDFAVFPMDFESIDIGEWDSDADTDDDDDQMDLEAWYTMDDKG